MRKFLKLLTSKFLLVCLLLLAEIVLIPAVIIGASYVFNLTPILTVVVYVFDLILVLYIINSDINAEYKIAWIVPILLLPFVGCILYLALRRRQTPRRKLKKLFSHLHGVDCLYAQNLSMMQKYRDKSDFAAQCAEYINRECMLPAADCYGAEYFPSGEAYAKRLLEELKTAKKFIFIEFFIIAEGKFWSAVLEILRQKVAEGVDVRLIYDDIGSMFKVPSDYDRQMEKLGIRCLCFNRFRPVLDVAQNNRTHRKIVVIDGITAFTGGVNLADEYVNLTQPFGHWKDTGVMIRGRAVQNFTAMFLQLWTIKGGKKDDYADFLTDAPEGDCLCIPFSDTPFDDSTYDGQHNLCEDLYLKIIYHARRYVYINTPYLIIDGEMKRALITAARSGVDVRITVPEVPDKKYVFALTKAFYSQLIKEGIKIYRYTPGFIHAKSIVSDGRYCIVGTSNMDFRSFYLHCECNAMFFDERISEQLHEDYLATCEKSHLVTEEEIKVRLPGLIFRSVMRIFAPLM